MPLRFAMPTGHFEPYKLTVGTVVGAFQGTNCYDVITDFGRYRAFYFSLSTGDGGVRHGGGVMPGAQVLLAFGVGEREAWILQVLQAPWQVTADEPTQVGCFPQVSGFELDKRFSGGLYASGKGGLSNRPSDVLDDLVNGEWGVASPNGPGLGVELYRSFLRGGAMSGIWCWGDTQLTRLAGLDFEYLTLAQNDYDRRHGNSIVRSRSRVLYPTEATEDKLPRVQEAFGAIHGGDHLWVGPAGDRGSSDRQALLHEHRGTDGSYIVSSASMVHLQRYVAMPMPEETVAPASPAGVLAEPPLDEDDVRTKVLAAPRKTIETSQTSGLGWVQHALDTVQAVFDKGNGGFDRLPKQWSPHGETPESYFSTYGKEMWRSLPQVRSVTVDTVESSKKIYVGRSSFTLMPDGSVVIEDAWHSQIIMSGGNIVLSAAHDVIMQAGRNIVGIAGNVAVTRAEQHVDIAANSGRVSIKAEEQLSLLGGNSGTGGVLIESKGSNSDTTIGTGLKQSVGGIVLKSETGLWADAQEIGMNARTGDVVVKSEVGQVEVLASVFVARSDQVSFYFNPDATIPSYAFEGGFMTTSGGVVVNGVVDCKSIFSDGSLLVNGNVQSLGTSDIQPEKNGQVPAVFREAKAAVVAINKAVAKQVAAVDKRIEDELKRKIPLNTKLVAQLGFTFPTSGDVHADIALSFLLPELRWQTISRRSGRGSGKSWVENPVVSLAGDTQPTSPYPGYENWVQGKTYRLHNVDLCFDLNTGLPKTPTEEPIKIEDEEFVSIDTNFIIGADS